jgi:hypothetical protein
MTNGVLYSLASSVWANAAAFYTRMTKGFDFGAVGENAHNLMFSTTQVMEKIFPFEDLKISQKFSRKFWIVN